MNRSWLDKTLKQKGISLNMLRREHHFSPDTLSSWEGGKAAKPATVRRLASILGIEMAELVRELGIRLLRRGQPLDRKQSVELAAKLSVGEWE